MSDKADELPEAVFGLGGESDVVAERSGATTAKARRPVPVDPPEAMDEAEKDDDTDEDTADDDDVDEDVDDDEDEDDVTRPDAGPTG